MAFVGGPIQPILRPAELEKKALREALHQQGLFGANRIFTTREGVNDGIDSAALFLAQEDGAGVQLNEQGSLLIRRPLKDKSQNQFSYTLAIIEETILEQLANMIGYASWVLEHVDSTQRLTHIAIAASIENAAYLGWRTQAEQAASPNSGHMRLANDDAREPICVSRPRAALQFEKKELAEDLMVPLRRQFKN